MKEYQHLKIEKKWQKEWENKKTYKTPTDFDKPKKYVLDMFPYPSGSGLHVGHPRGYIGSDVYARKKRMEGFNVLHPMGYDAFGLPAEQYALEHNIHPEKAVKENIATFKKQLSMIGLSYDWDREVNTTDPSYYKWTQWIFLKIYNSWFDLLEDKARPIKELEEIFSKNGNEELSAHTDIDYLFSATDWNKFSRKEKENILMKYRLAYEGHSEVNWCPKLGTVLANDEIINDKNGNLISERGHHPVEKKLMRQWFMRITAYADRLLDNLEELDWSDHIKEIQRNWIGRSEGAEIDFLIKDSDLKIKVFTTRADTLFGATYVVLSPEHKLVDELKNKISNWKEVERFRDMVKNKTEEERTSVSKEKNGICLKGIMAINPANKEEVPVWIADYVLVSYGTGAVMAVPAHDERDWDFANKYKLPIKVVIEYPKDYPKDKPYTDYGIVINSEEMSWANGLLSQDAMLEIIEELEYKGLGKEVVKYKMRDAIFARQRYWGEPIPLIHNKDQTITALKEEDLPLKLPSIKSYSPSGTGESPLSLVSSWVKKGYETNTMPGWAGSSWYFLRYMDPKNNKDFASKKSLEYWNQVDMYIGGQEHSTGHLLYSRFWTNLLYDLGHLPFNEPFKKMKNQGMILGSDNRKMSKRWGNVVNPDDIIKTYGADTLRVYTMFMGPFDQMLPWSTESIIGSRRFLEKVWRIGLGIIEKEDGETSQKLKSLLHKTIKKTDQDIESFSFNTAVSSMMIFINELDKEKEMRKEDFKDFLKILSPFAPHLTEELWSFLGEKNSITQSFWPSWDEKLLEEDMIRIAIQVNGKVRDEIEVDKNMDERDIKNVVVSTPNVKKWIGEKEIKRFIYIPGKIINIVV